MSVWSRYLIKETSKIFIFFIFALYFLFSLIDYSSRIDYYNTLPLKSIITYYICILSQKSELLIPFAFLATIIRVLFLINHNNELVSMLMSGRSYKKLLRPLFIFALALSAILYLNFQFLEPHAQKKIQMIKQNKKSKKEVRVRSFILDDGSKLIFSHFDFDSNSLEKVYWLKSSGHFYYMQSLYPFSNPPIGHYVYEFTSSANQDITLESQADARPFHDMKLEFNPLVGSLFSARTYSITSLIKSIYQKKPLVNVDRAELLTLLHYKLAFPLIPLFILMTLIPICTKFSRHSPVFIIYMISIALLLSFYTLMDACTILSENKLIFPPLAIWLPFILYFAIPLKRFIRY